MSLQQDIERIALQEQRLRFARFDTATAWTIGERLKAAAEARHVAVAIDIRFHDQPLFFYAMPGTTPNNVDWIRRKNNVVRRFHSSSYAIGRGLEREGTTLEAKTGVALYDYATHGGAFPIYVEGTGCVGTITVSGLPQRDDHELVVAVLAGYLGVALAEVSLDSAG